MVARNYSYGFSKNFNLIGHKMAIYTEDINGNLTLVKVDKTLADLAAEGKIIAQELNLPSDCFQENIKTATEKQPKQSKSNSLGE